MITTKDMANWLRENDHDYSMSALEKILDTYKENKAGLLEKFRKHPNWDEDAMAIILRESKYNRGFNQNAINDFYNWAKCEVNKVIKEMDKYDEVYKMDKDIQNLSDIITFYRTKMMKAFSDMGFCVLIDGDPMIYPLKERWVSLKAEREKYINVNGYEVEKDFGEKYQKVMSALGVCRKATDYLMTAELAKEVNEILDVKAVEGQKLSKVIRKICCHVGLDTIKKITDHGSYKRDDGFNREYAMLCDQINPIEYKRITVISLNPLDYWSMSHGKKWTSCHYVGNGDDGCYSSGTESYMLDSTSIIYYVIDEEYEGTEYHTQPKERRCVFCIDETGDAILQSRVYPDGRDGGDQTLSTQFRTVMQKVVSELWNKNNYWDLKKGTSNCNKYTSTCGTHYEDYRHYEDCNVSINKDANEENICINIGHDPICPECGYIHNETENISCCSTDKTTCDYCGDRFDYEEEGIYCEDNGCYYCCDDCAERDGVHYCEDDGYYHDCDHCFYDEYRGRYISGEPEIEIDGCCYASIDNALEDGWEIDDYTDEYYRRDDMYWCEDEGVYIYPDNGDYVETDDGYYYTSADQAEKYGYVYCENENVWINEDNAIYTEDDTYYTSEEAAKENGYTANEDGEWVKEREAV